MRPALAIALLLCACSAARSAEWRIAFRDRALERPETLFDVRVRPSCGSNETLDRWIVQRASAVETLIVDRRAGAIEITAIDAECRSYAFRCAEIEDGRARIELAPVQEQDQCESGACSGALRCARPVVEPDAAMMQVPDDAGAIDGGGRDAGPRDAGPDPDAGGCPASCRYGCDAVGVCGLPRSCAHAEATEPGEPGVRRIDPTGVRPVDVYCAGDGWTLAAKIDGALPDFRYNAALWTDETLVAASSLDPSPTQAKLAAFLEVPFREIRLDFEHDGGSGSITVPIGSSSLRDLFAGPARSTSLGRDAWLDAMPNTSIQTNCNLEGINRTVGARGVRIGIFGNQEDDCNTPDSAVGIGMDPLRGCDQGFDGSAGAYSLCDQLRWPAFVWVFVR